MFLKDIHSSETLEGGLHVDACSMPYNMVNKETLPYALLKLTFKIQVQ